MRNEALLEIQERWEVDVDCGHSYRLRMSRCYCSLESGGRRMIRIEIHDVEDFMALCEILQRIREGYYGGE